jgi:23S rRNA pseudouridine1911/1915/1917 synthase
VKQAEFFSIVYEDSNVVAVNKASGIAVAPDRWDESKDRLDTRLADFLNSRDNTVRRLFTVHRIDRDTSGLVVFAKDAETHRSLSRAFEDRLVKKRYTAVIHGRPSWKETVCDLPLIPNGNKRGLTIIDKYQGKRALTRFTLILSAGNYSVAEAFPETGRTHQIRVHAAALGHPVVCDPLYSVNAGRSPSAVKPVFLSQIKKGWRGDPWEEKPLLARLGLHAAELIIPSAGTDLVLRAPLPRDMAALIKQMGKIK